MKISSKIRLGALLLLWALISSNGFAQQQCSFPNGLTTNPKQISVPNTGGTFSFGVSAVPTCTWVVQPNLSFIHILSISYPDGSNNPGIGSATVKFSVDPNTVLLAPRGDQNFAITVRPHDGNEDFVGVVQAAASGDFSISVSPGSVIFAPGGSQEFTVTWTRTGDFNGNITPGLSFLNPAGITGSFRNNSTVLDVFTTANTICPGDHTFTISGQNGNVTRTAQVPVSVIGDFSLSINSGALSAVQGTSAAAAPTVAINRSQSYGNAITLSASGVSGVSAGFTPNNTTGSSSTLAISAGTTAPVGTFPLTITGTGGCLTRSTVLNLSIIPSWWPAIEDILQ